MALATSEFRHDGEMLYVTDDDRRELEAGTIPAVCDMSRLTDSKSWPNGHPLMLRRSRSSCGAWRILAHADWQQDWQQAVGLVSDALRNRR
jgi:hypothetical protein